jgi:hypothetical protein
MLDLLSFVLVSLVSTVLLVMLVEHFIPFWKVPVI